MRIIVYIIAFIITSSVCLGQQSNTESEKAPVRKETGDSVYKSPRKATIYSAVLPGLGQVYNRKIWKVPIVYAGLGGFGYFAYYNQHQFNRYKTAYINRQEGLADEFNGLLSSQGLLNEMDRFRRYRDLNILGFLAIYAIQIIDANVDAHLFRFDVSDDLTFNIQPALFQTNVYAPACTGISCHIEFK
ncbi:MAG TPA: DUF5683 domain-containing protein [Bacteroidales bacterium]|nr:DUF5683 domain-containing protein [Bacteroidales bacterium]HQP03404.1 DUF5683 domain-containing protein [Bacteroidales bacterium]